MIYLENFDNYIFDLDGTLINSMPVWRNVGRDFVLSKGFVPPENLEEIFKTMSFEESAEYFIKNIGINMTVEDIIKSVTQMVAEKYINNIQLKDYVYEFIKKSFDNKKHMSILTASEEYYIIPLLKRINIDMFFDKVITCTNIKMSKSSYEIYNYTADIMGYNKHKTAVFEDALHAVKNAKKAQFFTVGVFDEAERENIDIIKSYSDIYINSFKELI